MKKIAVVYWSGTGNTERMAQAVVQGVKENGGDGELFDVGSFEPSSIDLYDAVAFGCPSMGVDSLEETEFEPFFAEAEKRLSEKKIALFGSYGWSVEWMKEWEKRCNDCGAITVTAPVICNDSPSEEVLAELRNMGKALSEN